MRGWWNGNTLKAGNHWQGGTGDYFYKYILKTNETAPFFYEIYSTYNHIIRIAENQPIYIRLFSSDMKFDSTETTTVFQIRFVPYSLRTHHGVFFWYYTPKGTDIPQTKGEKKTFNFSRTGDIIPSLSGEIECISIGTPGKTNKYWDLKIIAPFPEAIVATRVLFHFTVTSYAGQETITDYQKENPPYFSISNKEPDR